MQFENYTDRARGLIQAAQGIVLREGHQQFTPEHKDSVDPLANPRRAWQYLPGQRRVKAAPDVAYDTPNPGSAGATTYDDAFMFNGAMDRYDFKLIGKKEMYVPYNEYKLYYQPGSASNVMKPKHINPDLERWELHRVWVVEATLKEGKRHIYHKRILYIDEDSWLAKATDQFDARGQLFVSQFMPSPFSYDALAPTTSLQSYYNFVAGTYGTQGMCGLYKGLFYIDPLPERDWSPDSMAGAGVR